MLTSSYELDEIARLSARVGEPLGVSVWHEVTQGEVDAFAAVTGDRQWIHLDQERARGTVFGGTIVHGYYTLSLAPKLLAEVLELDRFPMAINYGLEKLRFPAPLRVGDRVRMRVTLDRVSRFPGGATLTLTLAFERGSGVKPACVAQVLYRVFEEGI
jgi:acyl dehydratase